ncbi:uncharacterized protein SPPG_07357 [Spizellomyces punctatus DAOM BR117]|uniref:Uncharacterized protein n=1 Tax=Spizellomyces punctatus (strain DAOM BR117) TaxID=645134 RepID=A0A0L0H917_SPIPD|nr:uncharacterized protein SPPG_07357 [Spizellomyces punctatus DAOM BR117]KNC97434.1 hypothetical protein SPPG_07357 [Spizellomyces punctatus DAOM BR117]|eukprot:XP_016605474.1 hypothetical protein SPPG_07357 [Spizellomyces punctatus DAOM BR117]
MASTRTARTSECRSGDTSKKPQTRHYERLAALFLRRPTKHAVSVDDLRLQGSRLPSRVPKYNIYLEDMEDDDDTTGTSLVSLGQSERDRRESAHVSSQDAHNRVKPSRKPGVLRRVARFLRTSLTQQPRSERRGIKLEEAEESQAKQRTNNVFGTVNTGVDGFKRQSSYGIGLDVLFVNQRNGVVGAEQKQNLLVDEDKPRGSRLSGSGYAQRTQNRASGRRLSVAASDFFTRLTRKRSSRASEETSGNVFIVPVSIHDETDSLGKSEKTEISAIEVCHIAQENALAPTPPSEETTEVRQQGRFTVTRQHSVRVLARKRTFTFERIEAPAACPTGLHVLDPCRGHGADDGLYASSELQSTDLTLTMTSSVPSQLVSSGRSSPLFGHARKPSDPWSDDQCTLTQGSTSFITTISNRSFEVIEANEINVVEPPVDEFLTNTDAAIQGMSNDLEMTAQMPAVPSAESPEPSEPAQEHRIQDPIVVEKSLKRSTSSFHIITANLDTENASTLVSSPTPLCSHELDSSTESVSLSRSLSSASVECRKELSISTVTSRTGRTFTLERMLVRESSTGSLKGLAASTLEPAVVDDGGPTRSRPTV